MLTIELLNKFGADTVTGKARCVNNESLYLRLVNMVPSNDSFNKLFEYINANDLDNAFQAAHNLKGVTANLALTPLYNPLCEISDLLRNKTVMDYTNLITEIKNKRQELEDICK